MANSANAVSQALAGTGLCLALGQWSIFSGRSWSRLITTQADNNNHMGRAIASIVLGIVVGVLAGVAVWSFLLAATWSSIHGGMSETILAVLSLVAMVVPPGCGFLAGSAIYRWWPRRGTTQTTDSICLNCPDCGCSMKPSTKYSPTPRYTVLECPIHGPFHFGPHTNLTLGPPPQI